MYCTLIYGYLFVSHKSFKCNLLYTFQFANFKLHVFSIKFVKFRLNLQFFLHFRYQTAHILVCVKPFIIIKLKHNRQLTVKQIGTVVKAKMCSKHMALLFLGVWFLMEAGTSIAVVPESCKVKSFFSIIQPIRYMLCLFVFLILDF